MTLNSEYSKWIKQFKEHGNLLIYQDELNWSNYYYKKLDYYNSSLKLELFSISKNYILKPNQKAIDKILGKKYTKSILNKIKST